mgnify:CR=1 FL=1
MPQDSIEELRKEIISKILKKGLLIDKIDDIKILNQNALYTISVH